MTRTELIAFLLLWGAVAVGSVLIFPVLGALARWLVDWSIARDVRILRRRRPRQVMANDEAPLWEFSTREREEGR